MKDLLQTILEGQGLSEAHRDIFKPMPKEEADQLVEPDELRDFAQERFEEYMSMRDIHARRNFWDNLNEDQQEDLVYYMAAQLIANPLKEAVTGLFQNKVLKDHPKEIETDILELLTQSGGDLVDMVYEAVITL